ncbi:MAG TPA: hypothetical protein VIK35_08015 [Verrucomicrobiae bacterium]
MKTPVVIFCALLAVNGVCGGIYNIAEQQARNVAAGEPPQGAPPPTTPPPQNNNPPAPPPNPALEATLKNISNLSVDFDALGKLAELKPDAPQKKLLLDDLTVAPQGVKPSPASTSMLADNLASAVAGKAAMQPQHAKLAQDIHAVFNGSHLSTTQQQMIFNDVQGILQTGGAAADDITNVVSDIKTMVTETK